MDRFTALLLGSLLLPTTVGAQDPDHVMELVSGAALPADILQVSLLFDNALDIGGYSLSVRNVPTDLQVLEVVPATSPSNSIPVSSASISSPMDSASASSTFRPVPDTCQAASTGRSTASFTRSIPRHRWDPPPSPSPTTSVILLIRR